MRQDILCVGLIGYGAIGQEVNRLLTQRNKDDITIVGALIHHPTLPRPHNSPNIVTTLSDLLAAQPQVIVEVAGHGGLREHGPAILRAGIDLLFVSVGALAEPGVLQVLFDEAQKSGAKAKVVSGAIGALDALASASIGELSTVIHTMRRFPETLLPPEEAARLTTAREVFRGNARQAAQKFPEFLNIAAAVALAGIGFDRTEVRVVADPIVKHSVHEVYAEGTFGIFRFGIENVPMDLPTPRGAKLVAMSIVRSLLLRDASLVVG